MPDIQYTHLLFDNSESVDLNKLSPYDLVRDAYHGTGGFRNGKFLLSHEREKDFAERQGYSFYVNHFKPIVDALVNPVFKTPPERENISDSEEYFLFLENCDLKGSSLNNFMRRSATRAKRDGILFLIMDNFPEIPSNFKDEIDNRAIPYIYWKKASDVVSYKTDKFSNLIEIGFSERTDKVDNSGNVVYHYRKWFIGGWELYENFEKGEYQDKIEEGVLPFNQLPVIQIVTGDPEDDPVLPMPPLYSVARISAAIYNLWSEYREIQRRIGFPILARPVDNPQSSKSVEMGAGTILDYPMEASRPPEFIQPGNEVLESIMLAIKDLKEEMYKQAGISGVTGVIELSGRAKEWDNLATQNQLSDFARELERVENAIVKLFSMWLGKDIEVNIKYSESFGIDDFMSEIEEAERLLDISPSNEVNQEIKKGLVRSYFSHMESENIKGLEDSINLESQDIQQSQIQDNDRVDG